MSRGLAAGDALTPTERPGRLVLLGHPVHHSLSPRFQGAALRAADIALAYEALDVPPPALPDVLERLVAVRGAGNVTIPHKEAVAARCAALTPVARRTGAVNTFWTAHGALVGDNTDVHGVRAVVDRWFPHGLAGVRCAVLGAGGAAAAVLVALVDAGADAVTVWSRTAARAEALARRVGVPVHLAPGADAAVRGAALVVNATPVGLAGTEVPVAPEALAPGARVFDAVYRAGGTAWVRTCRARGHVAVDGLPMLIAQGAAAFTRWFGVAPDLSAMWEAVGGEARAYGTVESR